MLVAVIKENLAIEELWKGRRNDENYDIIEPIPFSYKCLDIYQSTQASDGWCLCGYRKRFHVFNNGTFGCFSPKSICEEGNQKLRIFIVEFSLNFDWLPH